VLVPTSGALLLAPLEAKFMDSESFVRSAAHSRGEAAWLATWGTKYKYKTLAKPKPSILKHCTRVRAFNTQRPSANVASSLLTKGNRGLQPAEDVITNTIVI